MPTLIRLVIILVVLAGIAYGAMFALVMFVAPSEKEVTIRIPARDLMPAPERDPLVRREIDTSRTPQATPAEELVAAPQAPAVEPEAPADANGVVTLSPGTE